MKPQAKRIILPYKYFFNVFCYFDGQVTNASTFTDRAIKMKKKIKPMKLLGKAETFIQALKMEYA